MLCPSSGTGANCDLISALVRAEEVKDAEKINRAGVRGVHPSQGGVRGACV